MLLLPVMAAAQQAPLRYYGQQDGLANLAVTALARGRGGHLWVGTENGVYRYNGASFRRYAQDEGMDEPAVTALTVDHEDNLWVSSYNKLYLKVGERLRPVLHDDGQQIDSLPSQNLSIAPDGTRYLVTGGQLYTLGLRDGRTRVRPVFAQPQLARLAALADLTGVLAEAGANLWLGCGEALCHAGPGGVTVWGPAQGVPRGRWDALLRDREGRLWASSQRRIIVLAPGAQSFADRTPAGDVMRKEKLRAVLAEDHEGRILSNTDDGLARWERDHWVLYGPANGLRAAGGITAVQSDAAGGLWLGSRGLGLVNWLGYGNWENWSSAQGLPSDVALSFVRDERGVLYAATRERPARLLPGARRFAEVPADHTAAQWSSLALDRGGQVWAATYSGLLARLGPHGPARVHTRALSGVNALMTDPQQRLWLATGDGISVLDTGSPNQAVRVPAGLPKPGEADATPVHGQCLAPDGTPWFLDDIQLRHLDANGWQAYAARPPGGNAQFSVLACSADGALWLADSRNRLWHATTAASGMQFRPVDQGPLGGAHIIALWEDRRGWLWVGTDAGVAIWNRQHWRFFDQNDGLAWNDTNGSVFYEDRDGSMWIATSNGVSHVLYPDRLFATQPLSVRIEQARHENAALAPGRPWTLPWSGAPLEVELASLHPQNRSALRYHYRMAGLESGWAESATPQLRYAALPPGEYQFEYYATNTYSHSASPLQRQAVTVLPPWWRTTPFYLLCAVLGLLLLSLAYRLRVRHLLQRQLHTEQLVRERTRELEQSREQLRQRALRDSLTGAWNRGAIMEIIEHALAQALAQRQPLLLVLLDLDHFKRINDNYGHGAGDAVLREAVARLGAAVRQSDAVGRYGGEEFLVVLPGLNEANGHARVEELRHAIRHEPMRIDQQQAIAVSGSFGAMAFDPMRPLPMAQLIELADQALYRAKENGRDRIEYGALPP
nr:diguanylate cyclase [Duganella sp. SG902]